MIFGIGTDIVERVRVQGTYERFGGRFAERILMPEEMALFRRSQDPVRFLGMRFAGKEATVKALGTGFAHGIWVRDVGIVSDPRGRPLVIFSERGHAVRRELGVGAAHVSLTDDAGLIMAFAVAETATG